MTDFSHKNDFVRFAKERLLHHKSLPPVPKDARLSTEDTDPFGGYGLSLSSPEFGWVYTTWRRPDPAFFFAERKDD